MAWSVEPIEVVKPKDKVIDPRDKKTVEKANNYYQWWLAQDDKELLSQLLSTTAFLKNFHSARIRQASLYSRLFSGKPLYNYLASTSTLDNSQQMPMGRPTANVVYSCVDTITSQLTQDNPMPVWIPDASKYRERLISGQVNNFIQGEFFRCKAYDLGVKAFRDSAILGNGLIKIIEKDNKVELQRTLETELLVDFNDAYYGSPRALIHTKLCDRGVMADMFPKAADKIYKSQGGTVDSSPQSSDTISDQIIIAEGWHLPSGEGAKDGRHSFVCSDGIIEDESWDFNYFPFEKQDYNDNMVGFFSQGLAEILFPTQMEIYKMLIIASQSLEMTGVPKIIISELSKVLETAFNNNISSIIKVKTMAEAPQFVNATSNNAEIYEYIKWLIENSYQISGISSLSANGTKPAGLNSGEAQREYMNIQSTRFSSMQKRYQNFYTGLASKMVDRAALIAKREGKYTTVYPGRDGTVQVDFPKIALLKDTNVIRCYEESSLPKDPVGRQSKLSEMLAAGEISNQEFRRLSRLPDLEQDDQLAVALEERILHDLDQIVEEGKKGYRSPDQFILDPTDLATKLTVQTYNKYVVTDMEREKLDLIMDYFTAIQDLKNQANPPQPQPMPAQASPQVKPSVAPPQPSISPTSNVAV
jgi:hypothetical protein